MTTAMRSHSSRKRRKTIRMTDVPQPTAEKTGLP